MRADLRMTAGKAASQAGHAFLSAFSKSPSDIQQRYLNDGEGTKVVLEVADEVALHHAYIEAYRLGLPCALVVERDHIMLPTFDGSPIITALGIGPVLREMARPITKGLRLMR